MSFSYFYYLARVYHYLSESTTACSRATRRLRKQRSFLLVREDGTSMARSHHRSGICICPFTRQNELYRYVTLIVDWGPIINRRLADVGSDLTGSIRYAFLFLVFIFGTVLAGADVKTRGAQWHTRRGTGTSTRGSHGRPGAGARGRGHA